MFLEFCFKPGTEINGALAELLLFYYIQHRMGRGDSQRVSGISPAQPTWCRCIHHLCTTGDRGERHPACQAFRHGDDIGLHRVVFHGKQLAGTGKSTLDFIRNQQNAVTVSQLPQLHHKLCGCRMESTFALHRLQHDRGDVMGRNVLRKNFFKAGQCRLDADPLNRAGIACMED